MIHFLETLGKTPVSTLPFWKKTNIIGKNKNESTIPTLIKDGVEYSTREEKANLFASKLVKTFNEPETNDFDNKFKEKIDKIINEKSYEQEYKNSNKNNVEKFTLKELNSAIRGLNDKTALDSTGLNNGLIKKFPKKTRENLLELFNKCLSEGKLPEKWKLATVIMIPKKNNDKHDYNNYRLISQTPCLAKLFERMIAKRLKKFLKKNNIIINCQSGFRQHRQTKDNIFQLSQKVTESFNRKKRYVVSFLI